MNELTELDAYKQLLEVTENILHELTPEEAIISKYHTLKKSILSKIRQPTSSSIPNYNPLLLGCYKSLARRILDCIAHFESEIEGEMSKAAFLQNSVRVIKEVEREARGLAEELGEGARGGRLAGREEANVFRGLVREVEGKVENMALMVEVHRKMHEIILEAADKEIKTSQKEAEYNKRLNEMEDVVERINNVKGFIDSYDITEKKARKFEIARKGLAKVLFEF
jgi:hypothetical protein